MIIYLFFKYETNGPENKSMSGLKIKVTHVHLCTDTYSSRQYHHGNFPIFSMLKFYIFQIFLNSSGCENTLINPRD